METSSKSKWQVRIAVLGIFMIGFVAGALTVNLYRSRALPSSSPFFRGRLESVVDRLDLAPEQEARVKEILDNARARLIDIRRESEPKFAEVRTQIDEQLRAVLTAEQWEQFQKMMSERKKGRRPGRGRRGPPRN